MVRKALFVIDMLNDFIKPGGVLYSSNYDSLILPVSRRVAEYRAANLPIIWICDSHNINDDEFKRFPPHAIDGEHGAAIINELSRGITPESHSEFIVKKTKYNGFSDTDLSKIMKAIVPDVVEVAGCATSICVMLTVAELSFRNFPTVIHRNCVADFDKSAHEFALKYMENILGAVII